MDGANNALKNTEYQIKVKEYVNGSWTGNYKQKTIAPATMFDINKALMRCLVKNLAMFGLGIYIYSGEDLPEGYTPPKPKIDASRFKNALKAIESGTYTEDKLLEQFDLSDKQQKELDQFMSDLEQKIEQLNETQNN